MGEREELVVVGIVTKPHALKGEVKVSPLNISTDRFLTLRSFNLVPGTGDPRIAVVEKAKVQGDRIILKFKGVDNRDEAEAIRNTELHVPANAIPSPEKTAFDLHDLKELHVFTNDGRAVGKIVDLLHLPAQDVYVIDSEGREILIPAVDEIVKSIDLDKRRLIIEPIEGLLNIDEI